MKALQGWKTLGFNVIMVIIALTKAVNPDAEVPGEEAVKGVIANSDAAIMAIAAVGNIILRAFTSSAIFKKKE